MSKQITTMEEFNEQLKAGEKLLLLKHSSTCPISHAGYDEYKKFVSNHPDMNACYLIVQDSRPLSNEIAEKFQVKHESPQAILFVNGEVEWHASHWKITNKSLEAAIFAQQ
ncbi:MULTISPECIES: bacillithiol system redox-active protein YtxJ [unclassified Bacillus (in: firmicutes)]|uniref:bacillithiol system redox-active protein YtxJ n=1 Tax=unclassified Bacillus (in: firmicutes) TaxID=185979 RepID=UPI0008E1180A|nr:MULTISPECIES: bacillithiol system redox-active protein YtxJ [unclassified Bacillus (in: firmicutes)]SFB17787.1 bacillithiol system protein YtxJ [Bacillus sp. UNCCL13]SFQ76632.1 bacillithiol system protein YtxJ [Bacillus sp. cl95]